MDTATKTGMDAAKTASKRIVQKIAEATSQLTINKIADKITLVGKERKQNNKMKEMQAVCIPAERRQQIINDLELF